MGKDRGVITSGGLHSQRSRAPWQSLGPTPASLGGASPTVSLQCALDFLQDSLITEQSALHHQAGLLLWKVEAGSGSPAWALLGLALSLLRSGCGSPGLEGMPSLLPAQTLPAHSGPRPSRPAPGLGWVWPRCAWAQEACLTLAITLSP